jgi:hypothetical protein
LASTPKYPGLGKKAGVKIELILWYSYFDALKAPHDQDGRKTVGR